MKKIIFTAAILITFFSCNKTFKEPTPIDVLISERWATDSYKEFWKDTSLYVANVYQMRAFKQTIGDSLVYFDEWMRPLNMHNFIIWQEVPRLGDRPAFKNGEK